MTFKIGDIVEVIDDIIEGRIIDVRNREVDILTDDGFQMSFEHRKLIKKKKQPDFYIDHQENIIAQKENTSSPKITKKPSFLEVDLHADCIFQSTKGMPKHEILQKQLAYAENKLEYAIKHRISQVVFIHGVGQGILREELRAIFLSRNYIEYFDASLKLYGQGATQINIYFSKIV